PGRPGHPAGLYHAVIASSRDIRLDRLGPDPRRLSAHELWGPSLDLCDSRREDAGDQGPRCLQDECAVVWGRSSVTWLVTIGWPGESRHRRLGWCGRAGRGRLATRPRAA